MKNFADRKTEYFGTFVKGHYDGFGILKEYDSQGQCYWTYIGDFKDGMKHGFGVVIFGNEDRSLFEGYFYESRQHGLGRYLAKPKEQFKIRQQQFALYEKGFRQSEFLEEWKCIAINNEVLDYKYLFQLESDAQKVFENETFNRSFSYNRNLKNMLEMLVLGGYLSYVCISANEKKDMVTDMEFVLKII